MVTFTGKNCETTVWPDDLHPGEPPIVAVSQDECALHSNDDVSYEWCEGSNMSLKQKSRGSLLMVSEFLSEYKGRLRCTLAEAEAYAAEFPQSLIAEKLVVYRAQPDATKRWNLDCRLILEPGSAPGKDKWFDAEQLYEQSKLALGVFEASHFAPARDVFVPEVPEAPVAATLSTSQCSRGYWSDGRARNGGYGEPPVHLRLSRPATGKVKHLPRVRCKPLIFYDHSSGHGARGSDGRSVTAMPKGPDWAGRMPYMRDGYYTNVHGQRVAHKMQFCEGDVLPIDVTVPTGVDVDAPPVGAPAALPKVLPEQLVGRRFCEETFDGPVVAEIALSNDTELPLMLVYAHDDLLPTLLVSVEEALRNLIGEAPVVEVELQDAPTAAEVVAAQAEHFKSRKPTLKKHNKGVGDDTLREIARQEWPALKPERKQHFITKARAAGTGPPVQTRKVLRKGEPVPRLLLGRHKGMEIILAERKLLPPGGLRAACPSESQHGTLPNGGLPAELSATLPSRASASYARRYVELLDNCCCCKRLLSIQPDFKAEVSQLERLFQKYEPHRGGDDTIHVGGATHTQAGACPPALPAQPT